MNEAMPNKPEVDAAAIGRLVGSALMQEGELWMNTHKELLANLEAMVDSWLQLHRAALDASSRAFQRFHACSSLAELFDLQREWASDLWGWTATTVTTAGRDGAHAVQRAMARSREPAEAGRPDILVRREPATKGAAETAGAAE